MADKNARTHSHQSNRAKPKDGKEKKVVFKGVLDSPFRIQWHVSHPSHPLRLIIGIINSRRPSIPLNLQNSILAHILELLAGTADYHLKQRALSSKRKREEKHAEGSAKKRVRVETHSGMNVDKILAAIGGKKAAAPVTISEGVDVEMKSASPKPLPLISNPVISGDATKPDDPHRLMHHVTFGINAVTKRLETQMQSARRPTTTIPETAAPLPPLPPLKYIFVCRADVDPILLVDHLPHLVAGFNSTRPAQPVKLVPLPKGAELVLSEALAVRRVTVLAVDIEFTEDATLKTLLESIPLLAASWLTPAQEKPSLIPTHIKLLKTTAPKDMKEAKEARMQGKAAAKQKKAAQKANVKSKPL